MAICFVILLDEAYYGVSWQVMDLSSGVTRWTPFIYDVESAGSWYKNIILLPLLDLELIWRHADLGN